MTRSLCSLHKCISAHAPRRPQQRCNPPHTRDIKSHDSLRGVAVSYLRSHLDRVIGVAAMLWLWLYPSPGPRNHPNPDPRTRCEGLFKIVIRYITDLTQYTDDTNLYFCGKSKEILEQQAFVELNNYCVQHFHSSISQQTVENQTL